MNQSRPTDVLYLGLAYGGGLYAAGFVLGVIRAIWLVDWMDEPTAIYLEIPVMLSIAWVWCGRLTSRGWLGARAWPRLVMGVCGLVVLLVLEVAGTLALSGSLAPLFVDFDEPHRLAGLAAQMFTAAIPWLRR